MFCSDLPECIKGKPVKTELNPHENVKSESALTCFTLVLALLMLLLAATTGNIIIRETRMAYRPLHVTQSQVSGDLPPLLSDGAGVGPESEALTPRHVAQSQVSGDLPPLLSDGGVHHSNLGDEEATDDSPPLPAALTSTPRIPSSGPTAPLPPPTPSHQLASKLIVNARLAARGETEPRRTCWQCEARYQEH